MNTPKENLFWSSVSVIVDEGVRVFRQDRCIYRVWLHCHKFVQKISMRDCFAYRSYDVTIMMKKLPQELHIMKYSDKEAAAGIVGSVFQVGLYAFTQRYSSFE